MFTILHISDLHFGPAFVPHVAEALLTIAPTLSPSAIVASGDFTQRAKPQQFADARAFLDRLPKVPLVVTPGNHDVPLYRIFERIFEPYKNYREHISSDLDITIKVDNVVFVALNSAAPHSAITNGRISESQLDFCEQSLVGADGAMKVVVAHHHFAPAPGFDKEPAMPKAKRAMDRFIRLGVDMVLGGHLHRAYIGNSLDVYTGPDREQGLIIVQCGTTTSRRGRGREREKNTFNFIQFDDRVIDITHYMYFSEIDSFAPLSNHRFPRSGKYFAPAS
jgi:3',5'-cyclic AMP phosphodiesterase CpdA